jgi:hypothetical protein
MLALRFANGIFEPIWNRQFIDHIQITVGESIGIEGRAAFYEQAGAIRDVFQNHLLQLVALTAMEPPIDFTADSVRNEKVKVLARCTRRGRSRSCAASTGAASIEGEEVPGYREEPGVASDSITETYVAAKLYVDNWRWADTPFYVRAGKRLPRRETTIAIQFQRAPHPPFAEIAGEGLRPNVLLIHVQPDEGVSLAIGAKVPGAGYEHPHRAHGLPLRRRLPHGPARGLRAPDPRRDAGRRDALHARRRGGRAMGARGRDRGRVEARPAELPQLPAGSWGPASRRRSHPPRRPKLAETLMASVVAQVEKRLAELRVGHADGTRTSVMTHVAWAPPQWAAAARRTLAGLEELHPSRTILLFPDASKRDAIRVDVELKCFTIPGSTRGGLLGGDPAEARRRPFARPGSIVQPLLITDLPTFCRWRGLPPWGKPEARAAGRRLRSARRRLVGVAGAPRPAYRQARASLRPDRRLRHRLGSESPWRGRVASPLAGRSRA